MSKRNAEKQKNIKRRNQAIVKRFEELHNKERLRYDDTIARIKSEFFLAERTILKIIKSTKV